MAKKVYPYEPDYVVPPGWLLEEYLEVRGWSPGEFAGRCGRSPELIAGIIAGEAAVDAAMAGELERTLGLDARIWLGIEEGYREGLAEGKGVALGSLSMDGRDSSATLGMTWVGDGRGRGL